MAKVDRDAGAKLSAFATGYQEALRDVLGAWEVNGETRGVVPLVVEFDEHWEPCSLTAAIERLDRMQGRSS